MIKPEELRIGNYVSYYGRPLFIESIHGKGVNIYASDDNAPYGMHKAILELEYEFKDIEPILLTEELLVKAGFEKVPHFTVTNSLLINIDRNRIISIGCVGTPNEMVYINEVSSTDKTKITDLICLRNYDYDGKTYFHHIQNLYFSLTGTELTIKL